MTLIKRASMEDWLAKVHPDAPGLPWLGESGDEACSFIVVPREVTGGVYVQLLDAHGEELLRSADRMAIEATCLSLNPNPMELTFLPVVRLPPSPAASSAWPRSGE